jgi:hypothetical protein
VEVWDFFRLGPDTSFVVRRVMPSPRTGHVSYNHSTLDCGTDAAAP